MFRLIRLLVPIALGIYIGIQYERWQLSRSCALSHGDYTGGKCLVKRDGND